MKKTTKKKKPVKGKGVVQLSNERFIKTKCRCADIDSYHHLNKYIDDMRSNKGKRIEFVVTGGGSHAHFICNTWKDALLSVAQIFSQKEPTI